MIIEKDGTISYAEKENSPREVTVSISMRLCNRESPFRLIHGTQVSGAEAILSKL